MPQLPKKPFLRQHLRITLPPLLMARIWETSPLLEMESLKECFSVAAAGASAFVWLCGWFGFLQFNPSQYIWGEDVLGWDRGEEGGARDASCRRPSLTMALRGRLIVRRRSSIRLDVRSVRRRCRSSNDGAVRMSLTYYFDWVSYKILEIDWSSIECIVCRMVYLIDWIECKCHKPAPTLLYL